MTNSNYGKSATIKHEPEVGDVYQETGNRNKKIYITEAYDSYICYIMYRKEYWGFGYYSGYIDKDEMRYKHFNLLYTYLGKAKNPITSIFEVQND